MSRIDDQLASLRAQINQVEKDYAIVRDTKIFLRELINATAVKVEAVERSGLDSGMYLLQLNTLAGTLAMLGGDMYEAANIVFKAKQRAYDIFVTGQDWRREIDLYRIRMAQILPKSQVISESSGFQG